MSRFHETFDKYVANPVGTWIASVGAAGLCAKSISEGAQQFANFANNEQVTTGSVLEVVGYAAGALAVGFVAMQAGRHEKNPACPPRR